MRALAATLNPGRSLSPSQEGTPTHSSLIRARGEMPTLEEEIRTYVAENFVLAADVGALAGNASLTRGGIVDSVGIVELIHFLETNYQIEIADDELVPENIDTIDNIVRYLQTKRGVTAAPRVDHDDARV